MFEGSCLDRVLQTFSGVVLEWALKGRSVVFGFACAWCLHSGQSVLFHSDNAVGGAIATSVVATKQNRTSTRAVRRRREGPVSNLRGGPKRAKLKDKEVWGWLSVPVALVSGLFEDAFVLTGSCAQHRIHGLKGPVG